MDSSSGVWAAMRPRSRSITSLCLHFPIGTMYFLKAEGELSRTLWMVPLRVCPGGRTLLSNLLAPKSSVSSRGPAPPPAPNSTSRNSSRTSNGAQPRCRHPRAGSLPGTPLSTGATLVFLGSHFLLIVSLATQTRSASVDHPSPRGPRSCLRGRVRDSRGVQHTFQLLSHQLRRLVSSQFETTDS